MPPSMMLPLGCPRCSGERANGDPAVQLLGNRGHDPRRIDRPAVMDAVGVSRLDRSICGGAGNAGMKATIGTAQGILPEDIVHSRYILLWGSNPLNTNPHLWP